MIPIYSRRVRRLPGRRVYKGGTFLPRDQNDQTIVGYSLLIRGDENDLEDDDDDGPGGSRSVRWV